MKRRQVPHPRTGTVLLTSGGRGGPVPPGPLPPGRHPAPPANPPLPNPLDAVKKSIADALGTGFTQAVQSVLGPGQVLLGVVLIAAGLLLASGQMGKIGRAGLSAATRGVVR